MIRILKFLIPLVLLFILGFYFFKTDIQNFFLKTQPLTSDIAEVRDVTSMESDMEIYITSLEVPWEIAFLPNKDMLVTLRKGDLLVFRNKEVINRLKIDGVSAEGEGGLLGVAVHPRFSENNFIYLYYTSKSGGKYENIVERFKFSDEKLIKDKVVLSDIRGNIYHNAGKIGFGPDSYLYVTAGDALDEPLAQDKNALAGKILRIDENGVFPAQNPYNNAVYSYGHRNPQGLTWDSEGNLWSTEHGQSGLNSGQDELNKIVIGGNYGWPNVRGSQESEEFISPAIQSGDKVTWAPGDTEYYNGNIFFTGLRGQGLYKYNLETKNLTKYLENDYGRLRAITMGPDGYFYITTSNRDGRGSPRDGDDKIIRINPEILK